MSRRGGVKEGREIRRFGKGKMEDGGGLGGGEDEWTRRRRGVGLEGGEA